MDESTSWEQCNVEEKEILRYFREKLGLTQQQVANKAKAVLRQYQRYESGERILSSAPFWMACNVLKALNLSIDMFYAGAYCKEVEKL